MDTDGKALAKSIVFASNLAFAETNLLPAYAFTDDLGKYELEVACDTDYFVLEYFSYLINYADSPWLSNGNATNINGTVGGLEQSDNGRTAVLKDIVADRSKPFGYVFNDQDNASKLSFQFLYGGHDYPLSYVFDVLDVQTNAVIGHFSGTLTEGDLTVWQDENFWTLPVGSILIDNTLPAPSEFSIWTVKGDITDSKGKKGSVVGAVGQGQ